jgi:ABC-type sugar transport system substrate-binding protein
MRQLQRERSSYHGITVLAICLSAAASLVVAACSSSSTGTGGSNTSGTSTTSSNVAAACAFAAQATKPVTFQAPGSPVPGSVIKGKNVWFIEDNASSPQLTIIVDEARVIGSELGASVHAYDAQGDVNLAATGVRQATGQGANVIIDLGVNPLSLTQPLEAAQAKGIYTMDVDNSLPDAAPPPGLDARVSWDWLGAAKARMANAICATDGKLNVGMIGDSSFTVSQPTLQGLQDAIAEWCPTTCSMDTTQVPVAEWATGLGPATSNMIHAHPNLNFFMPEFGTMDTYVLPALAEADPSGRLKVNAFQLDFSTIGDVESGKMLSDVGISYDWLTYQVYDQALRLLDHQKPIVTGIPFRMVTPKIATQLGLSSSASTPQNAAKVFGDSYIAGFMKLWGVS